MLQVAKSEATMKVASRTDLMWGGGEANKEEKKEETLICGGIEMQMTLGGPYPWEIIAWLRG
jgi:hypothetical protein